MRNCRKLRAQVDRLIVESRLRNGPPSAKVADLARDNGLSLHEVLGKMGKGEGSVPPKYRDPKSPQNTWMGVVAVCGDGWLRR